MRVLASLCRHSFPEQIQGQTEWRTIVRVYASNKHPNDYISTNTLTRSVFRFFYFGYSV